MKRLLIVSPHFPPVNAADMHRVRQCLPYLRDFGWDPVVFAVEPECVEMARDELLVDTLPGDVEVHRIRALPARWTRQVGLGNLGIRCWLPLRAAVDRYLGEHRVDLIFFSTTVFVTMALGSHWKQRYGVPFVLDLQDPWRNDYYLGRPRSERPRKFWFDYRLNRFLERRTVPKAVGIVAVSPAYPEELRRRYPATADCPTMVLPFAALPEDMAVAARPAVENRFFAQGDEQINLVYTGVLPPNMRLSLSALFGAVRTGLDRGLPDFSRLRFHFVGTSYATGDRAVKVAEPLAAEYGLGERVVEQSAREPYFNALRLLLDADLLLLPGTTDSGYTASKLYPYILAGKPILAIFNEQSSVVEILRRTGAGEVVTFREGEDPAALARRLLPVLAETIGRLPFTSPTDWDAFEEYSARAMTKRMTAFFDALV